MADQIGTVRVELVAHPSGIKRGIEDAGASLTRFAAIGATIGNLVADAFVRLAGVVKDKLGEVVDVTSVGQIGVLASVAMHVARGEWQEAWEAFKRGPQEAARIIRETGQVIADTWNEVAITSERAGPMVLGPWITLVHKSEELQQRMRLLRDEATAALADRTKTETEIIAAAQVAYQEQAINVVRFEEIKRQAYLRTQEAMLSARAAAPQRALGVDDSGRAPPRQAACAAGRAARRGALAGADPGRAPARQAACAAGRRPSGAADDRRANDGPACKPMLGRFVAHAAQSNALITQAPPPAQT
jgi:hypothetical protein